MKCHKIKRGFLCRVENIRAQMFIHTILRIELNLFFMFHVLHFKDIISDNLPELILKYSMITNSNKPFSYNYRMEKLLIRNARVLLTTS